MGAQIIGDALLVGGGGGGSGSIPSFGGEVGPGTSPPPGDGQIVWNASPQNSSSNIYVSAIDSKGKDIKASLLEYPRTKDILNIRDKADSNHFQKWEITSITDSGTYVTYGVTLVEENGGDIGDGDQIVFGFDLKFDQHALHVNVGAEISSLSTKAALGSTDVLVIEDGSDSFNKKKITGAYLLGLVGGVVFQTGDQLTNQPGTPHPATAMIAGAKEANGALPLNTLGDNSISIGIGWLDANNGAGGDQSIAVGRNSRANGTQNTVIGDGARAQGDDRVTILGASAGTGGGSPDTTIIGWGANALGDQGTAVGVLTDATGEGAIAVGGGQEGATDGAQALGKLSIAIGGSDGVFAAARAESDQSIIIGAGATSSAVVGDLNQIAIGTDASTGQEHAIALGAGADAGGVRSVSIGYLSDATAQDTSSLGYFARAIQNFGVAIGSSAFASAQYAHALGYNSSATTTRATAVGANARASGEASVAIGSDLNTQATGANAFGAYSIAIGSARRDLNPYNVATPYYDAPYTESEHSIAIGTGCLVDSPGFSARGIAMGNHSAVNEVPDGIVIGTESLVTKEAGIAIGRGAYASEGGLTIGINLLVDDAGTGLTDGAYTNVPTLPGAGGFATGLTVDFTVSGGSVSGNASVNAGGAEYLPWEVITIDTSGIGGSTTDPTVILLPANFATESGNDGGGIAIGSSSSTRSGPRASGEASVAIGNAVAGSAAGANAKGNTSVAIGSGTTADGDESVSIGAFISAGDGNQNIVIGRSGSIRTGYSGCIKLGYQGTIWGNHSIGIGTLAQTSSSGNGAISIGRNSISNSGASVAIGGTTTGNSLEGAYVSGGGQEAGIAIGGGTATLMGARVTNSSSIAIGTGTLVEGTNDIAIGREASFTGSSSSRNVGVGRETGQGNDTTQVVCVGDRAQTNASNSIAIGADAVNDREGTTVINGVHMVRESSDRYSDVVVQSGTNSIVGTHTIDATEAVGTVITSGTLQAGALYEITGDSSGNFAPVGAPDNNLGTVFRCTDSNITPSYNTASLTLRRNFVFDFPADTIFYPDRIDIINDNNDDDGDQMFYRAGDVGTDNTGDEDKYKTVGQLGASVNGPLSRESNVSIFPEGCESLNFDVTTASTHTNHTVRVLFEGKLVKV